MTTIKHSPQFLLRRKFYLYLPGMVIPSLLLFFYSFGGGKTVPAGKQKDSVSGYNANLPGPQVAAKNKPATKLDVYQKADADSIRRQESQRLDPYHAQPIQTAGAMGGVSPVGNPIGAGEGISSARETAVKALPPENPHAEELLQKLAQLQKVVQQKTAVAGAQGGGRRMEEGAASRPGDDIADRAMGKLQNEMKSLRSMSALRAGEGDSAECDPQLEKLNGMLDKIIRIQHPADGGEASAGGACAVGTFAGTAFVGEAAGGASVGEDARGTFVGMDAIPAVVQEDQELVAGATIALRLTEAAMISGVQVPRDQLVYGMVSINQDRMPVTIQSIRQEHVLIPTALQVYDMDGLPGIHIPGSLNRDVARQSADQGVGAVGLTSADPSIGAQAASAGIQAARTLLSRKVRLVRVYVRAGYQVLLKDVHTLTGRDRRAGMGPIAPRGERVAPGTGRKDTAGLGLKNEGLRSSVADTVKGAVVQKEKEPAFSDSLVPFLHHRVHTGKMQLILQGTYLRDSLLWFSLLLHNRSAIDYVPQYSLWTIRDRRVVARTAMQEIRINPVYSGVPAVVRGDSSCRLLIGFRPFALPHDKELVWEVAEKDGARMLGMRIGEKVILKAKKL